MATFDEAVRQYGSVSAAMEATGHVQNSSGSWVSAGSGGTSSSASNGSSSSGGGPSKSDVANNVPGWDLVGGSSGGSSGNSKNQATSVKNSGTDFYGDALNAAYSGDADAAYSYLAQRASKMSDPNYTGSGGGTSMADAYANVQAILSGRQQTSAQTIKQTAQLPSYQAQTGAVDDVYAAAQKKILAQLDASYQSSRMQAEEAKEKIPAIYQGQANTVEAEYEKEKQAFNESAAASGLNTGTGSQAELAMSTANQGNQTTIRTAEANALSDAEAQLTQLYTNYQSSISEAISSNEYERAAALLSEYQKQAQSVVDTAQNQAQLNYNYYTTNIAQSENAKQTSDAKAQEEAENLAAYGDFSGYSALGYTASQIANMETAWAAANPDLAYNSGKITSAQYKTITGKAPTGVAASTSTSTKSSQKKSGSTSTPTVSTASGYDNGGLTTAQVMQMQTFYGTDADGMWGESSKSASGGLDAQSAWAKYVGANSASSSSSGTDISNMDTDDFTNPHTSSVVQVHSNGAYTTYTWAAVKNLVASGRLSVVEAGNGKYQLVSAS